MEERLPKERRVLEVVQLITSQHDSSSPTYVPTLSYIIQSSPEGDAEMEKRMEMKFQVD